MKIVSWDLETTDLKALMGRVLVSGFKPISPDEPSYAFRGDEKPFRSRDVINDHRLVVATRNELEKYNMVVAWNGRLFDLPYLNARLLKYGERPYRPQFVFDPMYQARGGQLRIGSSKLINVQRYFSLSEKTEIAWEQWQRAGGGDKAAMNEVVEHCLADVATLAEAYWKLLPMVSTLHR